MPKFERILFPVDFSERSRAAAPFVLSMAQRHHSNVVLLNALQPPPPLYAGMNTVYPEVYDFQGLSADLRAELEKFAESELPKVDVTNVVEMGDQFFQLLFDPRDRLVELLIHLLTEVFKAASTFAAGRLVSHNSSLSHDPIVLAEGCFAYNPRVPGR